MNSSFQHSQHRQLQPLWLSLSVRPSFCGYRVDRSEQGTKPFSGARLMES